MTVNAEKELKVKLAQEAIKTVTPEDSLMVLYSANKLLPEPHINIVTNREYTNTNVWSLELSMLLNGFTDNKWATFNQFKTNNKIIKKGSKATKICVAVYNKKKDEKTQEEKEVLNFFKGGSVFNVQQTE